MDDLCSEVLSKKTTIRTCAKIQRESLFQPEFRINNRYCPCHFAVLTDKELILFGEKTFVKKHKTGEKNYGIITTYIPLDRLVNIYTSNSHVNISLENTEVLQLIYSEENRKMQDFYNNLKFLLLSSRN